MDNFTIKATREGHLHFCGLPTGYWVETGKLDSGRTVWYLNNARRTHPQAAWFKRRKDVMTAVRVFIEGREQKPDESARECAIRAIQSCLETGSTDIIKLTK